MKRLLCVVLVLVLMVGVCVGCEKVQPKKQIPGQEKPVDTRGEETALSVIDAFVEKLESRDTTACEKYLEPDTQAGIEEGDITLGKALQIDNAVGFLNAAPTISSTLLFNDNSVEVAMERKEVVFEKQEENKAAYYIEYTVTLDGTRFSKPEEHACIVEFELVNKDNKWHIKTMREISPNVDIEVLADGMNIVSSTNFSGGIAFIQYRDEEGTYHSAAIDTTGKILFMLDETFQYGFPGEYKNGIMVVDELIYDTTGKIIASPEMSGYDELLSENCNGYVLAMKKEESFTGDKYHVGVLNNKGQWEYALSAENPIAKVYNEQIAQYGKQYSSLYVSDIISETILAIHFSAVGAETQYYNIATNELTAGYIHYEYQNYQGRDAGIYKYGLSGEKELLLKDKSAEVFFEKVFIGTELSWGEDGYQESGYKIYDYNGNVITDLSDYKLTGNWSNNGPGEYYVKEHLLIPVENGTGAKYLCLINKQGETAFEPIRMGNWDDFYPLDEKGFVYKFEDPDTRKVTYKHYDFSGTIVEYEGLDYFGGFYDGLAAVKNAAGQIYYINTSGEKVIR